MNKKLIAAYIILTGLPLFAVLTTLEAGRKLLAPHLANIVSGPAGASDHGVLTLFLQIGLILAVSRAAGLLFRKIGQPQVVGEMAAGILLGPSLLGWVSPQIFATVFPSSSLGTLGALSQIGLVLFMFQVGLELDVKELKSQGHAAILTSHAGIVVPFALGTVLAYFLYPMLSNDAVSFTGFALFMGSAMSMTAFPVLARILSERGLTRTRVGTIAIGSAAVGDVTGWCILAYIVVLFRAQQDTISPWVTFGGAILYVIVMTVGLRRLTPWFERSFHRHGRLSEDAFALMVLIMLASALVTQVIGIHLLFGAFLAGAVMPKSHNLVRYILHRLESLTTVVLLPLFFAASGLRTTVGKIRGRGLWICAALVIGVAVAGKLGGAWIAARVAGFNTHDSLALGVLMNTRGLMELVVLNIGVDLGVISQTVFSIMVLMALATTFMTTPLLALFYKPERDSVPVQEPELRPLAVEQGS